LDAYGNNDDRDGSSDDYDDNDHTPKELKNILGRRVSVSGWN